MFELKPVHCHEQKNKTVLLQDRPPVPAEKRTADKNKTVLHQRLQAAGAS